MRKNCCSFGFFPNEGKGGGPGQIFWYIFISEFLLNKMKSHEAAMELKKQVQEGRVKKRESMAHSLKSLPRVTKGGERKMTKPMNTKLGHEYKIIHYMGLFA